MPVTKVAKQVLPDELNPFKELGKSALSAGNRVYAASDFPAMTLATNSFGYANSINSLNLPSSGLAVISGTTVTAETSISAAVNAMTSGTTDYVIYLASNYNLSAADVSALSSVTSAKSITFVADNSDNLSTPSTQDSSAKTLTLFSTLTVNVPTVFRNINLAGTATIYANGKNFAVRGGAYFTGNVSLYGGSATGTVTSTNLWIGSTGSGTLTIYGGGASGTVVSENTAVNVSNTSGNTVTVYGGGNGGTVSGNTNVAFASSVAGGIFAVYGGDANKGKVTGATYVDVTGTNGGTLTLSGNSTSGAVSGNINLGLSGLSATTTVATIYGDANSMAPALVAGRLITVTVNCPGDTFQNPIVATAYKLATSAGLVASTVMNINVGTVPFISGGTNGVDAFTNANTTTTNANTSSLASNPPVNSAVLNLGSTTASSSNVGSLNCSQIYNFTTLNLEPNNQLTMSASGSYNGYIYNSGVVATNSGSGPYANYQSNYSTFGNINLWENSVLDLNIGVGDTGNSSYNGTSPLIQASTLTVSPNCDLETPLFNYNSSNLNPGWSPSNTFWITLSGFILASADQSGTSYTSVSSLTWEPNTAPSNNNNTSYQGTWWGAGNQAYPIMILVPSTSGNTKPNITPASIQGYSSSNGYGFISDYYSLNVNPSNASDMGSVVYMQYGGIRQFEFNGSNSTDGSGTWNLNGETAGGTVAPSATYAVNGVNVTTGISGSSPAPAGALSAYASYFKNTVNGTTFYNLASLIYPTSAWSGKTDMNPGFFQTIGSTNYITHADVQTPDVLGQSTYIQWEWPQSSTSPGGTQTTKPVTLASDPAKLNTSTSYTDYAPGSTATAGYVPDSATGTGAWPYPNLGFGGMPTTGNYGFFPSNYFNGTNTINYSQGALNEINWTSSPLNLSGNAPSFLVYNTATYYTNDDGSTASPPLTSATGSVSGGGITVQQEAEIAAASSANPYNGATDTYLALRAIYAPTSTLGNGAATMTPAEIVIANGSSSVTVYYNQTGTNTATAIYTSTEADFAKAVSTTLSNSSYATTGTTISVTYHSSNGNDYSGTISVQSGSLTASNATTVTSVVNAYASDMASGLNAGNTGNQIAQDLIGLTAASATDVNNMSQNSNILITGWNDGTQYSVSSSYTSTQLYQQIITDLSQSSIAPGMVFTVTFSAPNGLGGTNTATAQITIIPGTISAENVTLTMAQAVAILKNDTTDVALASDLMASPTYTNGVPSSYPLTSVGAVGANVSATIGTDAAGNPIPAGTQLSASTSISSDGKTLSASTSIMSSLNSLIAAVNNTMLAQTSTMTFSTIKYGIATTVNLTVMAAGTLSLQSVPSNIDFGSYSSVNPPNWSDIPEKMNTTSVAVILDTRATASPWELTVYDDTSGGIAAAGGTLNLLGSTARSDSSAELSDELETNGETIMGAKEAAVVYNYATPLGSNTSKGEETVTISPEFYLSFPATGLTNSVSKATDTLHWTLEDVPTN
ncbi:beta strand repeat-containing protein [Lactococcus nasutitermitis]|uniref:Beta strand repeat-containing protein n=1 Tax=Lactococcus nasutitermitis TaxID=1652957 RepID=A0ABV9JDT3_9LACT|nr:hypothetical protein [Lactococcus nasutitermitis]